MAAARRLLLLLAPLTAQAFLQPSSMRPAAAAGLTARHPMATTGRQAAAMPPSSSSSSSRGRRLSMLLGAGGGAEHEVLTTIMEPTTAAASVAFLGTLLNVAEETTYSKASYYTTLALYLMSFPGLISLVTRSVKSKDVRRTFVAPGPKAKEGAKEPRLVAGEVMAYFTRLGYTVADNSGGSVTFKGVIGRSKSQAFFLVFCTFLGLVSLALVLSIQFQDFGGQNWFYITLLSPYAGVYYWQRASREDTVQVKLETPDDEETTEIVALGNKEELERMATTLNYGEKGMVRVQGIFEQAPAASSSSPQPPASP